MPPFIGALSIPEHACSCFGPIIGVVSGYVKYLDLYILILKKYGDGGKDLFRTRLSPVLAGADA